MMLNIQTIKWVATGAIMVATVMRALNFHTGDIIIGLLGTVLWGYCAYKMEDKPLLIVNGFCGIVLILGLIFG